MSNPKPLDVYNAFWTKLSSAPSFKTKSETWDSYTNDTKYGRPALYLNCLGADVTTTDDGLPQVLTLTFEVHCRVDRKADPSQPGFRLISPLEEEVKGLFKASPVTGFQTLGFPRGWVMHCQWTGTEYFYDLIQDDGIAEWVMAYKVLCAPAIGA